MKFSFNIHRPLWKSCGEVHSNMSLGLQVIKTKRVWFIFNLLFISLAVGI